MIKWENSGFWFINKNNQNYQKIRDSLNSTGFFFKNEEEIKEILFFVIKLISAWISSSTHIPRIIKPHCLYKMFHHLFQEKEPILRKLFWDLVRQSTNAANSEIAIVQTIFKNLFEKIKVNALPITRKLNYNPKL